MAFCGADLHSEAGKWTTVELRSPMHLWRFIRDLSGGWDPCFEVCLDLESLLGLGTVCMNSYLSLIFPKLLSYSIPVILLWKMRLERVIYQEPP